MPTKERKPRADKSGKPQAAKPAAANTAIQAQPKARPAALAQRSRHDPESLSSGDVRQLQRTLGNHAVARLLSGVRPHPLLQPKLTVGAAHDPFEQEADRVAAQVVSQPAPPAPVAQRAGAEEELPAEPLAATITPPIQRAAQADEALQDNTGGFEAGAGFEHRLGAARGSGTPLPGPTRNFMEQRIGADFSGVKVHTDARSDQLNRSIQAKAFTTGPDVFFRQGEFDPASRGGRELLAHELTHVVQQGSAEPVSPADPSIQRKGPDEDDELQRKTADPAEPQADPASPQNTTGLPDRLKAGIEALSGVSLDNVNVHYNSSQPEQLNALAYTQGRDIHVAPGQEQHLPHEAWHVVQQAQGRVPPTTQLKDRVPVNDQAGLEREADVMGARAALGARPAGEQSARPDSSFETQALSAPVVQRAAHRAELHSTIRYQGQQWTVQVSAINNPMITIFRPPNNTVHLNWAQADYTIIRPNNNQDHDLRQNNPGAVGGPVDAYEGLSSYEQQTRIRERFNAARRQALQMIKAAATPHVNQQSLAALQALTLEDFHVTRQGLTLLGAGKPNEAAEWEYTWVEGNQDNPRRTWTFVIDSDKPLPTSSQEPHVGWTVSAVAGSQPAVGNTFGHVWLDHVPVMRV